MIRVTNFLAGKKYALTTENFKKKSLVHKYFENMFLGKIETDLVQHSVFKTVYVPYFRLFRKHKNFKCL